LAGHLITVAKVQGASYKVAELIVKESKLIMKEDGKKPQGDEFEGNVEL